MNRRPFYVLLSVMVAIVVVVIACTRPKEFRADHGLPQCEYTAELDSLFAPMFPDDEPGAIVAVMRNDTIIYDHAFGLANLDSMQPVTDSTLFNMASTSKIFCATALLKLCEQGLISLDDSLARFFPEFEAPFYKNIRVHNILTHSSGLPDLRPRNEIEWSHYLKDHSSVFGEDRDYRLYGSEKDYLAIFQDLDSIDYTPNTHYLREDPSFILVVPLIERVTGHNFDDWMEENIFKPAGLTDTYYFNPGYTLPRIAHGYRRTQGSTAPGVFRSEDGNWEEYDYGEAEFFLTKADRGAYSSARDFMRWNKALYSGKILSEESLKIINTGYIPTDVPYVEYGLANAVESVPGKPQKVYHLNTNGGFSIIEATIPSRNISYVILAARADWDQRKTFAKVDSILLRL